MYSGRHRANKFLPGEYQYATRTVTHNSNQQQISSFLWPKIQNRLVFPCLSWLRKVTFKFHAFESFHGPVLLIINQKINIV